MHWRVLKEVKYENVLLSSQKIGHVIKISLSTRKQIVMPIYKKYPGKCWEAIGQLA